MYVFRKEKCRLHTVVSESLTKVLLYTDNHSPRMMDGQGVPAVAALRLRYDWCSGVRSSKLMTCEVCVRGSVVVNKAGGGRWGEG